LAADIGGTEMPSRRPHLYIWPKRNKFAMFVDAAANRDGNTGIDNAIAPTCHAHTRFNTLSGYKKANEVYEVP
jgi:hypothetical protein